MIKAVFDGVTPKGSAVFLADGTKIFAFVGRTVESIIPVLQKGASVAIELEDVPMRNGSMAKRVVKVEAIGQGPPPQVKQVGNYAPAAAPAPGHSSIDRDEMIYSCGVVNNYVRNTGDTSVSGLVSATLNARTAFRVAWLGEPLPGGTRQDMNDEIPM